MNRRVEITNPQPKQHAEGQTRVLFLKDDASAWTRIIQSFPWFDVFHTAEYADFAAKQLSAEAALLVIEGSNGPLAAHPLLLRPLSELPFAADDTGYDAISPDYAGPLLADSAVPPEAVGVIWQGIGDLCRELDVVSEFGRLNPFAPNLGEIIEKAGATTDRSLIYLDLVPSEEPRRQFDKGNRSAMKKAQRFGVEIVEDAGAQAVEQFHQIYIRRMEELTAGSHYRVSKDMVQELIAGCGGRLFSARVDGETVAAALFLADTKSRAETLHYYFSGATETGRMAQATNLLLAEVIGRARAEGFRRLHLGGGRQPGDSLESFKRSFSRATVSFYTYRRIHDPERYGRLCLLSDQYRRAGGRDDGEPASYFPEYRR